jgi:ArsR family transcriptional regulator
MRYTLAMDTTLPSRTRTGSAHAADTAHDAEPCCDVEVVMSPDSMRAITLADRLKALADPTRLRMLDLLAEQPEPLCVCEITNQFALHQPTISHHLRILRETGLIRGEKRGTWAYYEATAEGRRTWSIVQTLA